ncbi:hypothetical protein PUNSTDRAFT_58810 [Punctularia strigosozonata HHB-11173 SS5]|uniref:uncharacterized protein n=1 Tax=Punctularia strigosozonata (strain HHB-11173) TaxID=741275 RepID=UPI0004416E76|nr:uncharacterized protein PUNSTDRAFT_58810 [Punctularia strigosozonata HHB-11173 SS5]EIN14122.1 hypothetical protein PUNSTDRAFT_58810 [Punctularia strigosozonata HHB-11173 SS5]
MEGYQPEETPSADTDVVTAGIRLPLGETRLLLAVIACHAARNDIRTALQLVLPLNRPFLRLTVQDFIKSLDSDQTLAAQTSDFIRKLRVSRTVGHPRAFVLHVGNMGETKKWTLLRNFYADLLEGLSGTDAWIAPHPSLANASHPVVLQESGWAALLAASIACGQTAHARTIWDDLVRFGVHPSTTVWNGLLQGFSQIGDIEGTLATWSSMRKHVKPDASTFQVLIMILFKARRLDEALSCLADFESYPSKAPDLKQSTILVVYNIAINGLLACKQDLRAFTLLEKLHANGPKPDITTYNTFLAHYGRIGDLHSLAKILQRIQDHDLKGDVVTFSVILSALLKAGRSDAPQIVTSLMRKMEVDVNVAIYTSIIDAMLRERDERHLKAAMELLWQMERNTSPESQPNLVTYVAALAGIHKHRWVEPRTAADYRELILKRMRERNIPLNQASFHILIKACLQNPDTEGVEQALAYYRKMLKSDVPVDKDTWFLLLSGLRRRQEWEIARGLVDEMLRSGVMPSGPLQQAVGDIRQGRTRTRLY